MVINVNAPAFCLLILFHSVCYQPITHGLIQRGQLTTNCGGVFESDKGVLQTPNFPGPYPTPIYCEWLIHAQRGKKIIIYFTQFYMNDSFQVSEYEYYQDTKTYLGKSEIGKISWKHDLSHLVAYKPYVLIQFDVETIANRHVRVVDHLLEVYGFNITYEIVDKDADSSKKTCSVKECSYLGNCIVSHDFSNYECQCFKDFFGTNCQYGPYCDPDNGVNQCLNGGRCKYFFGSLINQCDCTPDYTGVYCDVPAFGNDPKLPKECLARKCSQLCEIDEMGEAVCFCYEGYKMDTDNGSCIPIARYRMDVSLELDNMGGMVDHNNSTVQDAATDELRTLLENNGISTITRFNMDGIALYNNRAFLQFNFYCKVSEVEMVQGALLAVVALKRVGLLALRQIAPVIEQSPELVLSEVSNFDPNPTLRGTLLTLVCAAKGSKEIEFEWYRNLSRLDTSLTQRDTWVTKVPHTVHGMVLSVLNIDNVSPLDAGKFTCNVTDFGETLSGSVEVNVYDYPKVELDFMSISVPIGESISIKCISHDDGWKRSNYEWYKNDALISHRSKNAYVEDIYPTGVRLVVPRITESSEYTCKVINQAGAANVTAYVYSIPTNETDMMCEKNYYGQVMWNRTAGGHFDVKRCPADQGVATVNWSENGYTTRACKCDFSTRKCSWEEPNFAKCQSLLLIGIYDQLQLLRFGYQLTRVQTVFRDLYNFIQPKKVPVMLYPGDIDMVAHILLEMVKHIQNFPRIIALDERLDIDERIPAQRLMELISMILDRSHLATPAEKSVISVGTSILETVDTLFAGGLRGFSYSVDERVFTTATEMRIEKVREVPSVSPEIGSALQRNNIRTLRRTSDNENTLEVAIFEFEHLADLLKYTDEQNNKDTRHFNTVVSKLYSVGQARVTYRSSSVRISIQHDLNIDDNEAYTTACLSWYTGHAHGSSWSSKDCTVVQSLPQKTVCDCAIPGHFVAARIVSNRTVQYEPDTLSRLNKPLLIGYSFSLLILCVALIIYIKAFCEKRVTVLCSIIFKVALMLVGLLCISFKPDQQCKSRIFLYMLMFFYLASFTSLTFEALHTFSCLYKLKRARLTPTKHCISCIMLPAILMVPSVVIATVNKETLPRCNIMCWLSSEMKMFYVYIVPVLILVLMFAVFTLLSLRKLRKVERNGPDCATYRLNIAKAIVIYMLLIVTKFLAVNIHSADQTIQIGCHVLFILSLSCSVLFCRCILDQRIRFLLGNMCFGTQEPSLDQEEMKKTSSFRAFVKPESNGTLTQEEYNVSQYYDEINRTKYTSERRRQLSSLLGSAAGSIESSTGTKSTSINTSSVNSKECELNPVPSAVRCQITDDGDSNSPERFKTVNGSKNCSTSAKNLTVAIPGQGSNKTVVTSPTVQPLGSRSRNVHRDSDSHKRKTTPLVGNAETISTKDSSKLVFSYKQRDNSDDESGASSAHARNISPSSLLRQTGKLADICEINDIQTVLSETSGSVFPSTDDKPTPMVLSGVDENEYSHLLNHDQPKEVKSSDFGEANRLL